MPNFLSNLFDVFVSRSQSRGLHCPDLKVGRPHAGFAHYRTCAYPGDKPVTGAEWPLHLPRKVCGMSIGMYSHHLLPLGRYLIYLTLGMSIWYRFNNYGYHPSNMLLRLLLINVPIWSVDPFWRRYTKCFFKFPAGVLLNSIIHR